MKILISIDTETKEVQVSSQEESAPAVVPSHFLFRVMLKGLVDCVYVRGEDIFYLPSTVFSYLDKRGYLK